MYESNENLNFFPGFNIELNLMEIKGNLNTFVLGLCKSFVHFQKHWCNNEKKMELSGVKLIWRKRQ